MFFREAALAAPAGKFRLWVIAPMDDNEVEEVPEPRDFETVEEAEARALEYLKQHELGEVLNVVVCNHEGSDVACVGDF